MSDDNADKLLEKLIHIAQKFTLVAFMLIASFLFLLILKNLLYGG